VLFRPDATWPDEIRGGKPTRSEESSKVRWVPRKDLGGYAMDRSMRLRIGHYLEGRAVPYLGLSSGLSGRAAQALTWPAASRMRGVARLMKR
jgi:hypothetical protein